MTIEVDKILEMLQTKSYEHILKFWLEDLRKFLSPRQRKIIKLKLRGYKNIEIAENLKVCPATITNELKRIKKISLEVETLNGNS